MHLQKFSPVAMASEWRHSSYTYIANHLGSLMGEYNPVYAFSLNYFYKYIDDYII